MSIHLSISPDFHFSQNDPRWRNADLDGIVGHGRTIGQWGCLGVAYCTLANHWDISDLLPDAFLLKMRESGAMWGEGVRPAALKTMFPDSVTYDGYLLRTRTDMRQKLREYLDAGYPVIGRVDFRPKTARIDQHWLLIIGENEKNQLLAIDPWTGTEININDVYGIAGSDVVEILLYRPRGDQPIARGSRGNGGGMQFDIDAQALIQETLNLMKRWQSLLQNND